ncbi:hypothetical protein LUZ60_002250 [Juncus effusus]|nr:hypothetical protein LUZ60_002250 [Juncus effusus]
MMDDTDSSTHAPAMVMSHTSRPTLGFPLGTALLIFVIFSLSGIFSCCYHWEKLRALRGVHRRRENTDDQTDDRHVSIDIPSCPSKLADFKDEKEKNLGLPVIMPGDPIPTFIAMPCPCQFIRPISDDKNLEIRMKFEDSIASSKISRFES